VVALAPLRSTQAQQAPNPAAPTDVGGEVSEGRAVIYGRVLSNARAVDSAEVSVVGVATLAGNAPVAGAGRSVRSAVDGSFRLAGLAPGNYFLRARRLGFEPIYFSATVRPGAARQFDVELERLPVELAEVTVRARSGYSGSSARRMQDFAWRRRSGWGRFVTRDDLQRFGSTAIAEALPYVVPAFSCRGANVPRAARFASDVDGLVPAVRLNPPAGANWTALWNRVGCNVSVSVNGGPALSAELAPNFPADWIEAVEVYRGPYAPAEFGRASGTVVVLWTGIESDDR
jgi:hypothetical protein